MLFVAVRSSSLASLDYFLRGNLKNEVYRVPVTTVGDIRERIITVCNTITAETLQPGVSLSLVNRLRIYTERNERDFEHRPR